MGLSLIAQGLLRAHLPETGWRPLVVSAGYAVGFIAVTLGRQQLFIETTLTACLPLLHEKSPRIFRRVVQLWVVVLASNLLGRRAVRVDRHPRQRLRPRTARRLPGDRPRCDAVHGVRGLRPRHSRRLDHRADGLAAAVGRLVRPFVVLLMTSLLAAAGLTHIIADSLEAFYAIFVGDYALDDLPVEVRRPGAHRQRHRRYRLCRYAQSRPGRRREAVIAATDGCTRDSEKLTPRPVRTQFARYGRGRCTPPARGSDAPVEASEPARGDRRVSRRAAGRTLLARP